MTEADIRFYEKLILKRMGKVLSHLEGHSREVLDLESGRDLLCSRCDLPLKPCTLHPGFLCCVALKGGTELLELEAALERLQNGAYGSCSICGRNIGRRRLKTLPASSLCARCAKSFLSAKSKEKKISRSQNEQTR